MKFGVKLLWLLLDWVVAFLTTVGLGLLCIFTPLGEALEQVEFLRGRAGTPWFLIGMVALGNPLGLMLTAIWRRNRRRLLAVRFLVLLAVSTGLGFAALHLSWEFELWTGAVGKLDSACNNVGVPGALVYVLLWMDAISLAACLAWYLVGWMITRLWPGRSRPAAGVAG